MDTKKIALHLQELNLSSNEISIYLTLLEQGPSIAAKIAQKTHIHRRNIYDALERLSQKGLISYIKENKSKVYSITNPNHILDSLQKKAQNFQSLLPELLSHYNSTSEKKETLFFQGKDGIKEIFKDQLEQKEEILIYAAPKDIGSILHYFFVQFDRERKEIKIPVRMICDESIKQDHAAYDAIKKIPLSKVKYIKEINSTPMAQYIYGTHVALIVWSDNPLGILIKQKEIADAFKQNFDFIWNR
jgi:sugar-specific transcriptional regulator TrmB